MCLYYLAPRHSRSSRSCLHDPLLLDVGVVSIIFGVEQYELRMKEQTWMKIKIEMNKIEIETKIKLQTK